ncbi:MAG: response regulator [Balneola sp.]|nr:MAG: response regulator [Balneola sp.]
MTTKKRSICIIDDDKVYTFGIKKILKNMLPEDNVSTYENGKEALQGLTKLAENGDPMPDFILLDIDMPEMNGWEFLKKFEQTRQQLGKEIEIFVISARIDHSDHTLYKVEWDDKVSDFISKPVNSKHLKQLLEKS